MQLDGREAAEKTFIVEIKNRRFVSKRPDSIWKETDLAGAMQQADVGVGERESDNISEDGKAGGGVTGRQLCHGSDG